MPLEKVTKSVVLHDGPFDESDRFLLRPPAVDYAENLHFHKNGNLQKRHGNILLTEVPDPAGTPFFMHAIGDDLHVLTERGARSFDGADWKSTDVAGFVGTRKLLAETPPVGGMGHVDMVPLYDADGEMLAQIVVYEVRERSSSDPSSGKYQPTPKHVVIQQYSPSGEFLKQYRIDNARSPKVIQYPFGTHGLALVVAQRITARGRTEPLTAHVWSQESQSVVVTYDLGISAAYTYGLDSHASKNAVAPFDLTYGGLLHTRLGASSDGHARYHLSADYEAQKFYIFYRKLDDEGKEMRLARFSGFDLGLENEILIGPYAGDDATSVECFDVLASGSNTVHVLWSVYETATPVFPYAGTAKTTLLVTKVNPQGAMSVTGQTTVYESEVDYSDPVWSGIPPSTLARHPGSPSQLTHGGLALSSRGFVGWMAHDSGASVGVANSPVTDAFWACRDWNQGLWYGVLNTNMSVRHEAKILQSHRLATRPFWFGGDLYAGVQQWIVHAQQITQVEQGNKNYANLSGASVPRTTVLACFGRGNDSARPVAYVDAGKSKTSEYTESEFVVHSPSVHVTDDGIIFPNRIVVRVEDASESTTVGAFGFTWSRLGAAQAPADALAHVYQISKIGSSDEKVSATRFGDGVIVGTAMNLWYDGRFFGELGPVDQPEIVAITDERQSFAEDYTVAFVPHGYGVGAEYGNSNWRKLQVVLGYYDARGNKHRSSPSSVIYAGGFTADDALPTVTPDGFPTWRGKVVRVYFTTPLSMLPSDLEYFAEVYASRGPDDKPVLVDTGSVRIDDTSTAKYVQVQLVRFIGEVDGKNYAIPPSTSETIYTAGGELAADPWPAFSRSVVTTTRLFAIDAVNKGKVLVSKRFADFVAPEYNSLLDINLGDERDLLCIGKLDDKTVIFEKDDIHIIYGDGPLNNGKGEDFAIHYLSTDVGCEDQESIVECPAGLVFFRKERGFHLLDRQLNIKYIGDRVHDLTKGLDVVAAELVSAEGHIRFSCTTTGPKQDPDGRKPADGQVRPPRPIYGNRAEGISHPTLVWNYEKDQWALFSNTGEVKCAASAIYQSEHTRLFNNWSIWQERENTDWNYTDPVGTNRSLLRTPWIPLEQNTQGYARLNRMNILGRYLSTLAQYEDESYDACDIQVKVWYDYEEGPDVEPQTKVFTHQDFGFDPFGKRSIRAERLQFTITPSEGRGRCQAVKLEFEEIMPTEHLGAVYSLGQGFEISAIDFEMGTDGRVTRHLPQAVLK